MQTQYLYVVTHPVSFRVIVDLNNYFINTEINIVAGV